MLTLAVIWRAAELLLATDAQTVIEVLPPLACRPVPGVPRWVRGVFVYRGELIPMVDVERMIADLPGSAPADSTACDRMINRVLVVRAPPRGEHGAKLVGLWVGSIVELERIDFSGPHTHPGYAAESTRFLGAIAQTRWGLVQLVDPSEMFSTEQSETLWLRLREAAA